MPMIVSGGLFNPITPIHTTDTPQSLGNTATFHQVLPTTAMGNSLLSTHSKGLAALPRLLWTSWLWHTSLHPTNTQTHRL